MLIRMDIKSIVVAGGLIPSIVVLAPRIAAPELPRELPIRIGVVEATAISTGANAVEARPKTHDFMLNVIRQLKAEIQGVSIVDVHGTTFYANLLLINEQGERIAIDCRPSDALALAVRAGVPIYAEDDVLNSASMPDFARVEKENQAREIEEFHSFIEDLSADDFTDSLGE